MNTQQINGIRKVSIRNFRGIERLDLQFLSPKGTPNAVVVLGGPNGCGKTSVLEACLIAAGYDGVVQGAKGEAAIRRGADDYTIHIELSVDGETVEHGYSSRVKARKVIPVTYFSSWRAPSLVGSVGITAGKKGKRPAKTEDNRLWRIKQFLVNARAHDLFPKPAGVEVGSESKFASGVSRLNQAWNFFYPEQEFSVEPVDEDPEAGFDIFLNLQNRSRVSVDELSAGQLELFCFAGGLIIEDPSPGLIVIDEPELHLDQQWHRQLIRSLQFLRPNSQLLVATHSAEIFDSVRSFERHFLVDKDDARAKQWERSSVGEPIRHGDVIDGGNF